jgi:hypothetical protein
MATPVHSAPTLSSELPAAALRLDRRRWFANRGAPVSRALLSANRHPRQWPVSSRSSHPRPGLRLVLSHEIAMPVTKSISIGAEFDSSVGACYPTFDDATPAHFCDGLGPALVPVSLPRSGGARMWRPRTCDSDVCEGAVVDGHALIGVLMMMPALNTLATSALVVPGLVMDCREVLDEWRLFTPSGPDLVILYGNIRR